MTTNKNPWHTGYRNITRQQFKQAWRLFRTRKENLHAMDWWLAGSCLAVEKNRFSPDPLICAQINRGQHPGQNLGVAHA